MADYWVDSNVFEEGRKGPYAFDLAPRFWSLVDEFIKSGQIASSILAFRELRESIGEMAEWASRQRNTGLFIEPDDDVQESYSKIVAYIASRYPDNQARRRFLSGVDPWLIAHAMTYGGKVVTLEEEVRDDSAKVKIPNVCEHFQVGCITTYEMLRELRVSWS